MLQFYFLSVLLNLLVGLILFYSKDISDSAAAVDEETEVLENDEFSDLQVDGVSSGEKKSKVSGIFAKFFGNGSFTDDAMFYLITGALAVFVGIIKLLSAVNGPAFFGDLIPALAGIAGGASVLIKYFEMKSSMSLEMKPFLNLILVESRKYVGIACMVIALLHFVLPGVLFI